MSVIGVDLDGILANFNEAYINLIVKETGRDSFPPRPFDITVWAYPEELYGYTKKEVSRVWEKIKESENFWFGLRPLEGAEDFLVDLYSMKEDIYFITSRVGKQVKFQTECWLMVHGFPTFPTVLISSQKGDCCRALGVDYYLDDRTENCQDVFDRALLTRCLMLKQPWNREVEGVPRIEKVGEFLEVLKQEGGESGAE